MVIEKAGAPQAQLQLGMPGVPRSSPDNVAAEVVFQVLAGGTSSRLFRNIREAKGYTYGIGGREDARRLGGSSVLAGSVKADRTGEAIRDVLEEIRRLREVLGLPAGFATAGGIAGHLAELVVHGLPDDHWNRYVEQVRAIGAEDVRRVAGQILDPSRVTLVVVGDTAVVRPQLEGLPIGPVEVRPAP